MLAASWFCRKNHLPDVGPAKTIYELSEAQADLVQKFVVTGCCSHEEFIQNLTVKNGQDTHT